MDSKIMTIEGAVLFKLHKLCATFYASVNINYRLPIKVYYRICTLRHIRIEINKKLKMNCEFAAQKTGE
jgi:hypothetical protein